MRQLLKRFLRATWHKFTGVSDLRHRLEELQRRLDDALGPAKLGRVFNEVACLSQAAQKLLAQQYRDAAHRGALADLTDTEFRSFSQNGEDGILLYLFSVLGTTNKKVVEICAGDGIECNAANLIVNHGWSGLLVDGDEQNIALARQFYATCRDTFSRVPTLVRAWVTAENVNQLLCEHGYAGEVDLLSLDIDGMDYWVWQALTCVRPRVVVLEFNYRWGPERAVTVPYRADFRVESNKHPWCCGASLPAFVKLGRQRGYRLIGTHKQELNAIFLRSDLGTDLFPEVSVPRVFERNALLRSWSPAVLPRCDERPDYWDVVEV
jgi:hypothetical protein